MFPDSFHLTLFGNLWDTSGNGILVDVLFEVLLRYSIRAESEPKKDTARFLIACLEA